MAFRVLFVKLIIILQSCYMLPLGKNNIQLKPVWFVSLCSNINPSQKLQLEIWWRELSINFDPCALYPVDFSDVAISEHEHRIPRDWMSLNAPGCGGEKSWKIQAALWSPNLLSPSTGLLAWSRVLCNGWIIGVLRLFIDPGEWFSPCGWRVTRQFRWLLRCRCNHQITERGRCVHSESWFPGWILRKAFPRISGSPCRRISLHPILCFSLGDGIVWLWFGI